MTTTAPKAGSAPGSGLSSAVAAERLARDGPNTLSAATPVPAWRRLASQMVHFFALMLWAAGVLAFVAGLPQLGVAIFVVVVVNGIFAFVQEHRAERAAQRLRDLLPRRATVRRDGHRMVVEASTLVVGDVVLLDAGDRISADLELDHARSLSIDVSTLTGESVPVVGRPGDTLRAGSFVVEGEGSGRVVAVGSGTALAAVARMVRAAHRPRSPLAAELGRVVRIVAAVAVGVGVAFFGVALLLGDPPGKGFLFAIGVTVALVPEGLLPTVTLSLAVGAQRMARRDALVRRLESVETLGSTTFICTDKTGTLTRNEMSVVRIWTPLGGASVRGEGYVPEGEVRPDGGTPIDALRRLALAAARCSTGRAARRGDAWVAQGDPTEAALDVLARRLGVDLPAERARRPIAARFPFDPERRRMSVVIGDELHVKGAPDSVLPLCTDVGEAPARLELMTGAGLRVLAVAGRRLVGGEPPAGALDAERDLELIGLVAIEDPPRDGVSGAIAACRAAGIRVAMLTGDHPATARAIAREVGLVTGTERVVLGRDLPDDEDALGELLDHDGVVVARVSPEHKLRIAGALQARGHVVAMTGDGVNDGPALQKADIGIAMGRTGTDVAREASDLVLLDDDFSTIVAAVEQGRATFSNVRRFLTYHLTDNVAELTPFLVWALSGGRVPLALGVLQVLSLDIGTDLLPALALGAERPGPTALRGPPMRGRLLDRGVLRRAFGVLGPTEATMVMAAFVTTFLAAGWRPASPFPGGHLTLAASGAAFSAAVIGQAANAFACRSEHLTPFRLGWFGNRMLLGAVGTELAALAVLLVAGPVARLLEMAPPTSAGFAVAVLAAPAVLAADALDKARRRRRSS
ncbi:MAG: cation-transporting P-type ATPase [Acidimicrobiia bacterium]|nr:cation-transporting P-type ATPase [Acidimicrobiia bacterium]